MLKEAKQLEHLARQLQGQEWDFEIVAGDCVRRLSPDSYVNLNSGLAWIVGPQGNSKMSLKAYKEYLDLASPNMILYLTEFYLKTIERLYKEKLETY